MKNLQHITNIYSNFILQYSILIKLKLIQSILTEDINSKYGENTYITFKQF